MRSLIQINQFPGENRTVVDFADTQQFESKPGILWPPDLMLTSLPKNAAAESG